MTRRQRVVEAFTLGLSVARRELTLLVAVLAVVLGVWGFVEVAEEVGEGRVQTFDERVLRSMRSADDPSRGIGPDWLPEAARDVTALGSPAILALMLLAVLGYLAFQRKAREMFLVALAAGGGGLLSVVLKGGFARSRPDVVPRLVPVGDPSFPSGHSMLAAVVYLTLGALLARLEARRRVQVYILGLAMMFAALVGLSRVYLGVHYPTDVLAGWSAGLAWAVGCWVVARVLQLRGAIASGDKPRR